MEKRLGLQNPQMSLLHGGFELLLRDTELALHSCSNWLRKQVHVQDDTHNNNVVYFILHIAMQLLHSVGEITSQVCYICLKIKY